MPTRSVPSFPGYRVAWDVSCAWVESCWGRGRCGRMSGVWAPLKPRLVTGGYEQVQLYRGGRCYYCKVHRLVLEAVVGSCPPQCEARHLDGVRRNNHPKNLQWATHTENMADKKIHGTSQHGEQHGQSKLTEQDVRMIRLRRAHGEKLQSIANDFDISYSNVSYIASGRTWKHLIVAC